MPSGLAVFHACGGDRVGLPSSARAAGHGAVDPGVRRTQVFGTVAGVPVPSFIAELRELVGHRLLWIASARAVVLDDDGQVLLGRDAASGAWALPGGIVDPGEHPADAVVRECFEETGVLAVPELLTSVTVSQPETHPNGDQTQHLEITFRCRSVGGEARPADGELLDVRWHPPDQLPDVDQRANDLTLIRLAINSDGRAEFPFSGVDHLLRADGIAAPRREVTDGINTQGQS
jgi:8-oxo-dGTP pyrophosphatase MutT (NUDIX family)